MALENINNELNFILNNYNKWETDEAKIDYIDKVEAFINACNESERNGEELVEDSIYDTCIEILRDINPNSKLLTRTWSDTSDTVEVNDDVDKYLNQQPMYSIQTIKHIDDVYVEKFKENLRLNTPEGKAECHVSLKENGHGIRIVYKDGELIRATSRGRSTSERKDLTEVLKAILGEENKELKTFGDIEIRGELLLSFKNFSIAKEKYNPNIKSPFTGVSSMCRASASVEEWKLLTFVAYQVITDNYTFKSREEQYQLLEKCGFTVPAYFITEVSADTLEEDIKRVLDTMEQKIEAYAFYTDGVVLEINDKKLFDKFGVESRICLGNLALKMQYWEQNMYQGVVEKIEWRAGKSKLTPVAILANGGTLTGTGSTVKNVPLYAPCYVLMTKAYPGNTIYFRYGGEAGVVPCLSNGVILTDKT